MPSDTIDSDQLFNWSAHERFLSSSAPSAQGPGPTSGQAPTAHLPRLPDRALQAVWPCRLQLPTGPRARAQILPFGQSSRRPARNGLRPRRVFAAGLQIFAELPESPPGAGADMQYQPRVVTASSEVLIRNAHGAFTPIPARYRLRWDSRRQFLAELVASRHGLGVPHSKHTELP
jgi:hypothetical protein